MFKNYIYKKTHARTKRRQPQDSSGGACFSSRMAPYDDDLLGCIHGFWPVLSH